jgi:hypothetical protein
MEKSPFLMGKLTINENLWGYMKIVKSMGISSLFIYGDIGIYETYWEINILTDSISHFVDI